MGISGLPAAPRRSIKETSSLANIKGPSVHDTPRNVLFITVDQWRGDCLGAMAHPCLRTPRLDQLAREGCLFRRHYGQTAPCGPARASLLTGQYLMNHRVVNNGTPLDAGFTNIALEVRRHGLEPTLIGYTDQTPDPRGLSPADPALSTYEGVLPGFSAYLHQTEDARPWLAWLRALGYPEPLDVEHIYRHQENYPGAAERGPTFPPARYPAEHSDTAFVTDTALGWLQNHAGQPWFLHLAYLRPHPPWVVPEPYHDHYHPEAVPPPLRDPPLSHWQAQHPYLDWHLRRHSQRSFLPGGSRLAAAVGLDAVLQARASYFGLMAELDRQIGRLLDYLATSAQERHTLVVFTSDHGEHLGDRFLWGKHGYFDEAYHIPLIIRDPDGQHRQVVDAFTEAVDLMPTLLTWLGFPVPAQCDGESLLPWVRGEAPGRWRDALHWEFDFRDVRGEQQPPGLPADQCQLAVLRDEHYKYVHFPTLAPLLFDLQADPKQCHNLAAEPRQAARVRDYAQRMLSWRMLHSDRRLANLQAGPGGIRAWLGTRY